jgi:hypothetical protein
VALDELASGWLTLPELADKLAVSVSRVRQLLREGKLVAVQRGTPPVKQVPIEFVHDGQLLKGLSGALTVLKDAGYDEEAALRWLLTDDDAIPGRPVDAMAAGRDTAVKRRAQVLAF